MAKLNYSLKEIFFIYFYYFKGNSIYLLRQQRKICMNFTNKRFVHIQRLEKITKQLRFITTKLRKFLVFFFGRTNHQKIIKI